MKQSLCFFKRHPEVKAALLSKVNLEVQNQLEVSNELFHNETFETLPIIKKWRIEKTGRVSPKYLNQTIGRIKLIMSRQILHKRQSYEKAYFSSDSKLEPQKSSVANG